MTVADQKKRSVLLRRVKAIVACDVYDWVRAVFDLVEKRLLLEIIVELYSPVQNSGPGVRRAYDSFEFGLHTPQRAEIFALLRHAQAQCLPIRLILFRQPQKTLPCEDHVAIALDQILVAVVKGSHRNVAQNAIQTPHDRLV